MDKKRLRNAYVPPQTEVFSSDPQHPLAATFVRAQGSDWTDGGETTIEFNFTSTSSSTNSLSAGTPKSVNVGNLSLKSVWEDSYDWSN